MRLKIKSVVHVHHFCRKLKGRNNTASMEIVHKVDIMGVVVWVEQSTY